MSDFTAHLRVTFANNIGLLSQQRMSRLRATVASGSYKGKAASLVDQYGATNARKRTGKFVPMLPANTPIERPWLVPTSSYWMDYVDTLDKLQTIQDPQSGLTMSCMSAMERDIDDNIVAAFFGDAKRGEQGATTVDWATFVAANTGHKIAVTVGAAAATGLNVAKLRAAKKALMKAEVDLDGDPLTCVATAEQIDNLLNEVQVTSADFNGAKPVLVEGKLTSFLGINFVHSERTLTDASGYRRVPIYAKSGMHLGIWEDISTDIHQRKELEGKPWQIDATLTVGATRTEEKKVVEVLCAE